MDERYTSTDRTRMCNTADIIYSSGLHWSGTKHSTLEKSDELTGTLDEDPTKHWLVRLTSRQINRSYTVINNTSLQRHGLAGVYVNDLIIL